MIVFSIVSCAPEGTTVQQTASSIDSLPVLRTVTTFTGTDQYGKPLVSESLKGHIWLGSFFFSRCETVCPALNTVQASLQKAYGDRVLFVSVSTDPEFDSPVVMKEYADRFGAQSGKWWFVNMPITQAMDFASNGLGLIPPSSPEMHSTRFALIDTAMRVRGYYDSADTADVSKLRVILAGLK